MPEPTFLDKLAMAVDDVLPWHDIGVSECDISVLEDEIIIRRTVDEPPFTIYTNGEEV